MAYGSIMSISNDSSEFNNAILKITGPKAGSTVTVTQGSTVINAIEDNGVWTAEVGKGIWVVGVVGDSSAVGETVEVTKNGIYETVVVSPTSVFNDNSWVTISQVSKAGKASQYWAVGDAKKVVPKETDIPFINFLWGNTEAYVFIIGINHNADLEGANLIHLGCFRNTLQNTNYTKHFCLIQNVNNVYKTECQYTKDFIMSYVVDYGGKNNIGGWKKSNVRTYADSQVINRIFPDDLLAVTRTAKKYTDNVGNGTGAIASNVTATEDWFCIPSPRELGLSTSYCNYNEVNYQSIYKYFESGNRTTMFGQNTIGGPYYYWLRSPVYNNKTEFNCVDGNGRTSTYGSDRSLGLFFILFV
mgnify:CR=1 FL=1